MKKILMLALALLTSISASLAGDAPCTLGAGGVTSVSVETSLQRSKNFQIKNDAAFEFEVVVRLGRGAARGSHFRNIELVHVPMNVVVYRKEVSGIELIRGLSSARLTFLQEMPTCDEARIIARQGGIQGRSAR